MVSTVVNKEVSVWLDEAGLISASRLGDQQAFNQLVLHYQDRIYNLAVRILGDAETADDVTQNTFITAYLNLPRFRNGSFRSWLFRIATNACYDIYRQYKRRHVLSIDHDQLAEEKLLPMDNTSLAMDLPEREVERKELGRIIQHALGQMDIDHRSVLILVDQQELDYREAALILGVPVGTVKSRLARARQRLRLLLAPQLGISSVA